MSVGAVFLYQMRNHPNFNFRHITVFALPLFFLAFYFAHEFSHDLIGLLGFAIHVAVLYPGFFKEWFSWSIWLQISLWGPATFGPACYTPQRGQFLFLLQHFAFSQKVQHVTNRRDYVASIRGCTLWLSKKRKTISKGMFVQHSEEARKEI